MNFYRQTATLIFLFFCRMVVGQELYFSPFELNQNLPSLETYHILQDRKGYIWFTTEAGVCRYDGKELKVFTIKDGISENVVFDIYEDPHGRIWFNTLSGYIFYYLDGKFFKIGANALLKGMCKGIPMHGIFIGENDTLYCAPFGIPGVIKIPPENNYGHVVVEPIPYCHWFVQNKKSQPWIFINGIGENRKISKDSIGTFYVNNKIISISLKGLIHYLWSGFRQIKDRKGNTYLTIDNLLIKIGKNGEMTSHRFAKGILNACIDKYDNLWINFVLKSGVLLFKNSDLDSTPLALLQGCSVSDVLIDREGSVWLCTLEKGILRSLNYELINFQVGGQQVVSYQKDKEKLRVTFNSGFVWEFKPGGLTHSKSYLLHDSIYGIRCFYSFNNDRDNYYCSPTQTMYSTGGKTMIIPYSNGGEKFIQYSGDTVLMSVYKGFHLINKGKKINEVCPDFKIGCIEKLKNRDVLVASNLNDGIFKVRYNGLEPYLNKYPELKTRINDLMEDDHGGFWVATNERGVFYLSSPNAVIENFNEADNGLMSDKVNSFDKDDQGNVWVATNKGLSEILAPVKGETRKVLNFDKSHGLPSIALQKLVFWDGKIWCDSKECFFCFEPKGMKKNNVPPLVAITGIKINNEARENSTNYDLKYDQNNISVSFRGLTYKNTEQSQFLYKLIGYDNDYIPTTTGTIQYTNLNPGTYKFEVYALNNDGLRSSRPAVLNFLIKKPFWQLWWMILLEISLFVALIFLIVKNRINRIKAKEEEKTLLNKQIAEFQMTAIRAQMNPHFIFNAISSIQHFILKNDIYESYEYLAKFSMLIRKVLDHSQQESITLADEISTLRLYIELEKLRFKESFNSEIVVDDALSVDDLFIPTMLIQPYVENAILHGLTPKQFDCTLFISFAKENNSLKITVRDNGVGRENIKSNKPGHVSKGMSLTTQRLKALGVRNEQQFSVFIIDLKDKNNLPSGTEVTIILPIE